MKTGDQRLWQVAAVHKAGPGKVADLELLDAEMPEKQTVSLTDLVVVAEFRDIIYPGLVRTGKVERGGDKPFHTVINGENYHVLKALTYTHRGKVDAIYIDPPYNTGAKDWKYNNDYVEGDDLYRKVSDHRINDCPPWHFVHLANVLYDLIPKIRWESVMRTTQQFSITLPNEMADARKQYFAPDP